MRGTAWARPSSARIRRAHSWLAKLLRRRGASTAGRASSLAAPAASLLLYPVCHPLNPQATAEETVALAELPAMLRFSPQKMRVMAENYLGRPLEEATAHDFPGVGSAEQLASLPRTYLEADEYDDLRCSARGYAEQLREAGVDVEYEVRRGVTHGHLNKVGLSQAAATMDRMASILEEL